MAKTAAIIGVVLVGGAAAILLAQQAGVDLGPVSSGVDAVKNLIGAEGSFAAGELGLSSDPVALALPIIKNFEGFSATAYPDPPGQTDTYSIGYGHQIQPGDPYDQSSTISEADASTLLASDVGTAYSCVTSAVETQLTPTQTAACISLCYNIGCTAFGNSTLVTLLNQGDIAGAADQFPAWCHAGGAISQVLVARRSQEQELFNS